MVSQSIGLNHRDLNVPPTAPGELAAPTFGNQTRGDQLIVNWDAATAGTSPLLRYEVQYRSRANTAEGATVDDDLASAWADATIDSPDVPTASTYTHMGVAGGVTYVYRVRAVNAIGAADWSDAAAQPIGARAPGVPVLTALANGKNEILLEWTVPAINGSGIEDYNLQRWVPGTGQEGTWTELFGTESSDVTLHLDTGDVAGDVLTPLVAGRTYYYRVQAVKWRAPLPVHGHRPTKMAKRLEQKPPPPQPIPMSRAVWLGSMAILMVHQMPQRPVRTMTA